MTDELTKTIIDGHMIRYTDEQKAKFRCFIKEVAVHYGLAYDDTPVKKNHNIIIGDIDKADVVLTAHYDTPVKSSVLLPNICFNKSPLILIIACMTLLIVLVCFLFLALGYILALIPLLLLFIYTMCILARHRAPNQNNWNDNTSGIITLLEIMAAVASDNAKSKTAYIFFDNEEKGLKGSRAMAALISPTKTIINFDCVGDGNHIIIGCNKQPIMIVGALEEAKKAVYNHYPLKSIEVFTEKKFRMSSDNKSFRHSIGVMAYNRKMNILYLDKIHTARDTNLDMTNIMALRDIVIYFLNQ